jgi:Tol biopolymer transport system component/predicted Ser/Thr protein kinase
MKPEHRQEAEQLFNAALEQEPAKRAAFLAKASVGDEAVRIEAERLLARQSGSEGFIEPPAIKVVTRGAAADIGSAKISAPIIDRTVSHYGIIEPTPGTTQSMPMRSAKIAAKTLPAHDRAREAKSDLVGITLQHYYVIEKIGEGGMGVVYRCWDEHLRRDVAIKVLPAGTLSDESTRKRFRREAQALARLNHPNIESVYDFDSQDGLDFLVMEYVPGTTLDKRLAERPLPEKEILQLTSQLADGMAAAHAQGIVHCDLKPGNLVVTPTGRLKILDFGLARLLRPSGPEETTASSSVYQGAGGTLSYMSPEQLTEPSIDSRSDIYSTGVVLYEMATGGLPFKASLPTALVNDIINKPPPLPRDRRTDLSPRLQDMILKCLEKDAENRYQSAKELLVDLRRLSSPSTPMLAAESQKHSVVVNSKLLALSMLGLAVVIAGFFWINSYFRQGLPDYKPYQVTTSAGWEGEPALSPNGTLIANTSNASGNLQIYVTDVRKGTTLCLTKDRADKSHPSWFPDGSAIAFGKERNGTPEIWETNPLGGGERLLLSNARSPAISPDGKYIAFCRMENGYFRVEVASLSNPGECRILTGDKGGLWDHCDPAWSPDGKQICYWTRHGLWTVPAGGGSAQRLTGDTEQDFEPVWDPAGRYIYFSSFRGGTLAIWRVGVHAGQPERITVGTGSESHPTISLDGKRFGYATGMAGRHGVFLDRRSGKQTVIPAAESEFMASVAPHGDRVALISGRSSEHQNLWVWGVANGELVEPPTQITDNPDNASYPAWSPDGRWIAYYRITGEQREIWVISNIGGPQYQFTSDRANDYHPAWSPDGSELAFVSKRTGGSHIWVGTVKDGKPSGPARQITYGNLEARSPAWSPDHRLLAFSGFSDERFEVWVVASDGKSPPRQITSGADVSFVRWDLLTGDLLASGTWGTNHRSLWRVSPRTGAGERFSPPVEFGGKDEDGLFDLSPDGQFLIFSQNSSANGHIWILEATSGVF